MESFFTLKALSAMGIAVALMSALNIDNGVVVDMQVSSLGLKPKQHVIWRSIALIVSGLMRALMLMLIGLISVLEHPQANWWFLPNRWFAEKPEELTWHSLLLFAGGLIVIYMAVREYWKKYLEELRGDIHKTVNRQLSPMRVIGVAASIIGVGLIFSADSVFTLLSLFDLEHQLPHMLIVIGITSVVMVFAMVPLGKIIHRNLHIQVQMYMILGLIGFKLLSDGCGHEIPNSLLMAGIGLLILTDWLQARLVKADSLGNERQKALNTSAVAES
ncbi:MAG: hypothetical protein KDD64_06985 [Bdellovibrionales bacterium]|nr:hypothetical protein [Bdellovibrionales bacterium]